jgi:hypothetical protein
MGALMMLPSGKFKTSYIPPIGNLLFVNLFDLSNVLYELKFLLMVIVDLLGEVNIELFFKLVLPIGRFLIGILP